MLGHILSGDTSGEQLAEKGPSALTPTLSRLMGRVSPQPPEVRPHGGNTSRSSKGPWSFPLLPCCWRRPVPLRGWGWGKCLPGQRVLHSR